MSDEFVTLAAKGEAETRVRGSRFLAVAYPATDEGEARGPLEARSRRFFDATHHCAAWRFRDGSWRAIDAGEPGGSAGAPILAAIDGAGLVDVAVVVTRYFGGTKLGVGGLIRAYGEAAADALDRAPRRRGVPAVRLVVRYPYQHTSAVMRALERLSASDVEHGFAEGGREGKATFTLPAAELEGLREILRDHTAGTVEARAVTPLVNYRPESR